MVRRIKDRLKPLLTREQQEDFMTYLPGKVWRVERNMGCLVAATQIVMILLFLVRHEGLPDSFRGGAYFNLYIFLLLSTAAALPIYNMCIKRNSAKVFCWVRRAYVLVLAVWLFGITMLGVTGGDSGLGVYSYLLPTLAAVLLMNRAESVITFGGIWLALVLALVITDIRSEALFSNVVNATLVMVLSLFISIRNYRSMVLEYTDREIIGRQYQEIQEANTLLNTLAYTDQLTGIYNRRHLIECLFPHFAERAQSSSVWGELLMLDIDYFKQFNDNFGHLRGDECLILLGQVLKDFGRQEGFEVVRYGGEEFLLFRLTDQSSGTEEAAARLHRAVFEAGISREDLDCRRLTVSIGAWSGRLNEVKNMEEAIHYADEALYGAKNSGRDCVRLYSAG